MAETTKVVAECWTCYSDAERLQPSVEDAVVEWADNRWPDPLPETVTVYPFARMELPPAERIGEDVLERLLEILDEGHSDPDGHGTKPTEGMKAAATAFAEAIRKEYVVWNCKRAGDPFEVKVTEYVDSSAMLGEREDSDTETK